MNSALVLGGTQFFGKNLVQNLINNGVKVTIATRGKTPDPFEDKVDRLIINREDRASLESAFENKEWDVVYDQTCYSSQEALDTLEVLDGKIKKYVFTSSQAVYEFGNMRKESEFDPYHFEPALKNRREYIGISGYTEAKRAAEAVLFQRSNVPVVAVRFSIVVGKDDYTERLKFHVDKVLQEEPMNIPDTSLRFGFIDSKEAANFLYQMGKSDFEGPINPGSYGDISLAELLQKIEDKTGKKAIISEEGNMSPYAFGGAFSVDNELATSLGYTFQPLEELLDELISYYINLAK